MRITITKSKNKGTITPFLRTQREGASRRSLSILEMLNPERKRNPARVEVGVATRNNRRKMGKVALRNQVKSRILMGAVTAHLRIGKLRMGLRRSLITISIRSLVGAGIRIRRNIIDMKAEIIN